MTIFTLRRFAPENKTIMLGVLLDELKMPIVLTLEHPWKQNAPFISCIPTGEYTCRRYSSAKYPDVWQICDVRGRDKVLIHWGNFLKDTEGCILVGEKFQDLNGDGVTDLAESKSTANQGFNELMERTKGLQEFKLVIEESYQWAA